MDSGTDLTLSYFVDVYKFWIGFGDAALCSIQSLAQLDIESSF